MDSTKLMGTQIKVNELKKTYPFSDESMYDDCSNNCNDL